MIFKGAWWLPVAQFGGEQIRQCSLTSHSLSDFCFCYLLELGVAREASVEGTAHFLEQLGVKLRA